MDTLPTLGMRVIKAPDSRLKIKTKPIKKITPAIIKLGQQMIKLAKSFVDPEGVGLAATQIGRDDSIFVAKLGDNFSIFINPKITAYGKRRKTFFEGCLSIPDFWGEVKRPTKISVEYLNERGEQIKKDLSGAAAWIFQHETDHLDGTLFIDHLLIQEGRMFKVTGKDRAGADIFEEIKYGLST